MACGLLYLQCFRLPHGIVQINLPGWILTHEIDVIVG